LNTPALDSGKSTRNCIQREISALSKPQLWQRIFASRVLGWVVAPAIGGAILAGGVAWLRHCDREDFRRLTANQETTAAFMGNSLELARVGNKSTRALMAIAILLSIPDSQVEIADDHLCMDFAANDISVESRGLITRIKLNRNMPKIREAMGHEFADLLDSARKSDPDNQATPGKQQ
jgi:hypothetical protein